MREFHIYLEKHSRYKATPRQNCWWLESQMGDIFVPHQCCWFYRSWAESFMCHSDQMVPDSGAKPAWSVCEGYSPGVHGSLLLPINGEKHPHHWLGSQCIFINLAGFARAQKADLSLERQCAREGLSRDSICLQEGKGNTSMSRAEKTLASVLCSALGPSECVIFPWPQR